MGEDASPLSDVRCRRLAVLVFGIGAGMSPFNPKSEMGSDEVHGVHVGHHLRVEVLAQPLHPGRDELLDQPPATGDEQHLKPEMIADFRDGGGHGADHVHALVGQNLAKPSHQHRRCLLRPVDVAMPHDQADHTRCRGQGGVDAMAEFPFREGIVVVGGGVADRGLVGVQRLDDDLTGQIGPSRPPGRRE